MTEFDPYYKWLGIAPRDQPPHHYRLLAIDVFESDADVIAGAADRQMAYVRQCAGGEHADASQRLLGELAQARLCLLNAARKLKYDVELRARLSVAHPSDGGAPATLPSSESRSTQSQSRPKQSDVLHGSLRRPWIVGSIAVVAIVLLILWGISRPASVSKSAVAAKLGASISQTEVEEDAEFVDVESEPESNFAASDLDEPADLDEDDVFENRFGIQLKRIPAGEFQMGTPQAMSSEPDERPRHTVRITRDFLLGVHEVTQREYYLVMEERDVAGLASSSYPIDNLTWYHARSFCEKLSTLAGGTYRLPTEAEWEYACRAGSDTTWSFGERQEQLAEYAWTSRNSNRTPHPVAQLKPNSLGLYDLCGNVAEWCQDWYGGDYYSSVETEFTDPQGPPVAPVGSVKIVRGGSWNEEPLRCRSSFRGTCTISQASPGIGFRVVRDVDEANVGLTAVAARSAASLRLSATETPAAKSTPARSPAESTPGAAAVPASAVDTKPHPAASDAEFFSLFDGYSLSGWSGRGYQVINGAIVHTHATRGALLSTNKQYGDFIFKCEVQVPADANNGIGFRAAPNADDAHMMEIQILDDASLQHKNVKPSNRCGSLLGVAAAKPGLMKPAREWNDLEISCDGTIVTVTLNGTQALKVNLTKVIRAGKQYRKNVVKFQQARGHITLMGFSGRVAFRNLRIKELPGN